MIWLSIFLFFVAIIITFIISKVKEKYVLKVILGTAIFLSFVTFIISLFTVIPVSNVGVQVILGKASSKVLKEGLTIKNPFAHIYKMNARYITITEDVSIPSKDKLTLDMIVSLVYKIDNNLAFSLFQKFGMNYEEKLVLNQFTSSVRDVAALHPMDSFFSAAREDIIKQIKEQFESLTKENGILTEQIMLLDVDPPASVGKAIENKMELEQQSEQMKFTLQKEVQEAERKRIEAQGIADFQKIVTEGINDNLLKWKGIEATQELAKSPNSKMVIIGGVNGLPIILNN